MAFQRRPDPPITIGQILEMAPGDRDNKRWINGVLTAGICDVKPNTPVTDAEPSTPASTRAQGPRSV